MKTLIIGVGAFGFAILNHLSKNNPDKIFYAFEKDKLTANELKNNYKSPYFFTDVKLSKNIYFLDDLDNNLLNFELIILTIPNQFIKSFIIQNKDKFKKGVFFLNLSKGIDNTTLKTVSETIYSQLGNFQYSYGVLSGGMIAGELIQEKILGADLGIKNKKESIYLKNLFENNNLKINIKSNYKNIELFSAFKNIIALYIGYLESSGYGFSSISYFYCEILKETSELVLILGGDKNFSLDNFSISGDLIATCFGNSRNKYLGNLVGKGLTITESLAILKSENKHSEGYETLKGLKNIIENNELIHYKKIYDIFIFKQ